ncbi:MAG TPA: DUF2231 domain-containing protein [Pseudonocardiaceae bacterium]|nr:DUF2231 domain-containing protein [Pseudonocardiaceae bacterium]
MNSKINIRGHPVHPMLVAYPIAFNTATLAGFIIYAASYDLFWLKLTIAVNAAAVVMSVIAAIPGFIDWAAGIPSGTPAKLTGRIHMALNVVALVLFIISFFAYYRYWNGPADAGGVLGIVLAGIGVALTVAAGFQGWALIQTHHIGIQLTPDQQRLDQHVRPH